MINVPDGYRLLGPDEIIQDDDMINVGFWRKVNGSNGFTPKRFIAKHGLGYSWATKQVLKPTTEKEWLNTFD